MSWLCEQALAQGEASVVKLARIASRGRIAHVGELVSLGRLSMLDLVEQSRRDRAVQHEVAVEQLNFLDSLPPPDRRICRRWRGVLKSSLDIWV